MNSRWASLLLGLLLLASLTACGDSQETVPRNEDGAWDDYVSWCSQASLEEPPGDEDQTYGEVSTFYAGVAERMSSTTPPVEVADWHNKYLDVIEAMKALIDAEPQDEIFNPIDIFFDSEVVSLFEEVGEALKDMPEDARERLAAAGCLGDDASEPTGEGLSVTPQPDSTAPADSGRTSTGPASMPKCEPRSSYVPALVALYNATDGPNWKDDTNWLTDAPLDDWAGVSANRITVNGRVVGECVTQLWLNSNRLKGELPAELSSLLSLAELHLSNNQLSGAIPAELGSLLNLRLLDLSDNQLSGAIPAELGGLPNLRRLDLANNQLSGAIPAELGGLLNLQRLYLGRNQLSGAIPAAIGNLPDMIWLSLPDNQLSGAIPAELGNIPTLVLDGNRLTGRVLRPGGANPQYAWEGSTIRVSWDAVDGADYYKVYYDADFDSSCDLDSDGRLSFCEELATGVTGTTYVHTNPSLSENYYWVVGCNNDGCSHIDKEYPAQLIGPTPSGAEPSTQPGTVYSTPTPRATRAPPQTPVPSDTPTPGPTPTQARTPSDTPTPAPTPTQTPVPSDTPTPVPTPTQARTPSDTPTPATPTQTPVPSDTPTPVPTPTQARTPSDTPTPATPTQARTPSDTPTPATPTQTPVPSDTPTPVPTPTQARTPSDTPTPATPTQTPVPSDMPTPVPTPTQARTPSDTPTPATPTQTPEPSTTPTPVPTPTQTPEPSTTPTPVPTPTQTPEPSTTPTPGPTPTHTPTPSTPPAGTIPSVPANVRFAHEDSTIHITWDPVAGADHYNIYHDDSFDSRCRLNRDGSAGFCEELARNVVGTTYVHTDPSGGDNYYWVVACNSGGCSEIDSKNPAAPAEAIPTAPANARYAMEGSTIRVSWHPVAGADHYNIYHDDFFDSRCRLNRDGSAGFCEELARNVVGTTYVHTDPSSGDNYYWVVACNRGGCSEIDAGNPVKAPGTSSTEATNMTTASQELEFTEGESATRSISENTPAGINVGAPVSAEGDGTLTYTLSGPDAASFTIVPTTGQVRTRDGVVYDYETENRYTVTVGADDESGENDTIEVTIHIEDLVAACQPVRNLRTNHGDGYVNVKWDPAVQREGKASVLGYQVEMRRGDDGPWTGRRTLLGRGIGSTIFGGLQNLQTYLFRIRPINTESDCGWSPPSSGMPVDVPTPRFPTDKFGTVPVGTPDRNWRFVNQGRCRYSADGVTLDANCQYENTGRDTSRITLEFDDPSRGSCDIALAFSSLTAGSFVDDCFDAGVNTETPFDTSFRMPRSGPQTETDLPRAPRSPEEFDELAWGRDDFIPGLVFGCTAHYVTCEVQPGEAIHIERNPDSGIPHHLKGKYTYENAGPSRGVLTFRREDGESYAFTMDFKPSGVVSVTVTDNAGDAAEWPGISDLALGADPVPLPIPQAMWDALATERDFAPADLWEMEDSIPTPSRPNWADTPREDLLERALLGSRSGLILGSTVYCRPYFSSGDTCPYVPHKTSYKKQGRNRARITISFYDQSDISPDNYARYNDDQKDVEGSTWVFDLTFTADGVAEYISTTTKEGEVPVLQRGLVDFKGDSIDLNEFPEEIRLPLAPPQAAGQDRSGVEVAAAISAPEIGGNDLQTFLISDQGVQSTAYQPGDWLEPKDGSNQRMLIVGVSQGTSAASTASRQPVQAMTLRYDPAFPSLEVAEPAVFHGMPTFQLMRFAPLTTSVFNIPIGVSASLAVASEPAITQLSVVCMQQDSETYRIPTRGDRYFSQPKPAEGAVQLCQRDCALNETTNVQECVWECEEN